ncbi:MAG: MBL fold metallo-hydrolase [Acidimicrobiia bacterium]|nr:MBL fold metallo-hydrolase [Acidimicrobiia bacterium]
MAVESIVDGVYQIGSAPVNSFLIDGDEGIVLVDTGLPRTEGLIAKALAGIGRSVGDVTAIVLTHSHNDHTGNAAAVKDESGAEVYASRADAPAIQGEEKTPAPPVPFYALPFKWLVQVLPRAHPVTVDHLVTEDPKLHLPGGLRPLDTPGHTPGHTSYLLGRGGGVAFVGDAAKATKSGQVVRGYFNRSTPLIDASIRHLAEQDFGVAVFGHSPSIRSGAAGAFRQLVESIAD